MHADRPDTNTAAQVEAGIAAMNEHSRREAANAMAAAGVPFPVIVRVLNESGRRRNQVARDHFGQA